MKRSFVTGLLVLGVFLYGCGGGGTTASKDTPPPPPPPLSVSIAANLTEGPAPLEVSFSAQVQGGEAVSYLWDFGDGQTSTEKAPTRKFEKEGMYLVKLTITSSGGATAATETTIKANPGSTVTEKTLHIVKMATDAEGKNYFDPVELMIKVGETVRWVNDSGVHDVSSIKMPEGATAFKSELLTAAGMTFEHTFTVPGEYEYVCTPHEALGMVGKIIVTP